MATFTAEGLAGELFAVLASYMSPPPPGASTAVSPTSPLTAATLDRELLDFATRFDSGAPGGQAEYHYEYLLVLARKPT